MFLDASEEFSKTLDDDPEIYASFRTSLTAEMQNQSRKLNASEFGSRSLPASRLSAYEKHMKERGLPLAPFKKDVGLVATRIQRLMLTFDANSGEEIGLLASPSAWTDDIEMHTADGISTVGFAGKLKDVKSGRGKTRPKGVALILITPPAGSLAPLARA